MSRDIVFGSYTKPWMAYAHARTLLGVDVVPCELFDTLPDEVRDDIAVAEYSEDEDTPVVPISFDDIKDKP